MKQKVSKRENKKIRKPKIQKPLASPERIEKPFKLTSPLFRAALAHLDSAVIIKDLQGKILFANSRFLELSGFTEKEILGKTLEAFLYKPSPAQKKSLRLELQRRAKGQASQYELAFRNKNGEEYIVCISGKPLFDKEGRVIGSVANISDVTAEKSALKSPRNVSALLQSIFKSTDVGICITDENGNFFDVNDAYCRTYGYSREELLNEPFTKVLPEHIKEYAQKLHDQYISEGSDESAGEWQVRHKNGSLRDILVTAARLKLDDGGRFKVTTVTDITERKWVENQLRYQANLLQNVSEAIISVNTRFQIVTWNKASEEIYGWREKSVVGKQIHEILPTTYLNGLTDEVATEILRTTGEWRGEVMQPRKDGVEIVVDSSVSLLQDSKGEAIGIVAINRDITAQKKIEQEKFELFEQLQQLQKMEAIGALSGGIAHDFNNLLAVISGNALMLKSEITSPTAEKRLSRIETAVNRAAAVTEQLLGFARKGKLNIKTVNLHTCVEEVIGILESIIDRRITIEILSDGDMQPIRADQRQIEQSILNLAVNALDAIRPTLDEKQSGKLLFKLDSVVIGEAAAQRMGLAEGIPYARLTVKDTGTGIPAEIRSKIFEPFFTTKEVGKGTGLGLSMVYGIVKNHHGAIEVDSETTEGASFQLYFPRSEASASTETPSIQSRFPDQSTSNQKTPSMPTKSILIVDDEEMLRELLVEQLTQVGYVVYECDNGREAVEFLKRSQIEEKPIDAVILDMNMPVMNGAKAFVEIRALAPTLPILVATGYALDETIQRMLDSGLNDVLTKPYDIEELHEKLKLVFSKS